MLTAIIPARGGSKGVKNKNLREIGGKSLVAIAVEKCLQVADRVYVSTEDKEIACETIRSGAYWSVRRPSLATDQVSTWEVIRGTDYLHPISGDVLLVQCTAPLVTVDDLKRVVDERGNADMSVLCHEFHGFILNDAGGCLNQLFNPPKRRQDMSSQYAIAGSAWAFNASYLDRPHIYAGSIKPVLCDGPHCDIDTEDDLETAKALHHWRTPVDWKMS